MVNPNQADLNCNCSRTTCRACIQLLLDVDGTDAIIDTQILKNTHILLVHLTVLDYRRKQDISTLKKDRGDIFLECWAEGLKANFLRYVKGVIFEMVD